MWLLLASLALAQVPCDETLTAPPDSLSVAWVSPVRKKVRSASFVELVPTTDLRAWLADRDATTVGDLLRYLGQRKRLGEPRRKYKVTILEATTGGICRPLEGQDESAVVAGVRVCPSGQSRATRRYAGCGATTDFNTGGSGPEVFRGRWRDVARRGFCVIPAERFVSEGARP